jgi:hypothetical protein
MASATNATTRSSDMTSVPTETRPDPVEQNVYRDVVGRFTSGVTVITTAVDG